MLESTARMYLGWQSASFYRDDDAIKKAARKMLDGCDWTDFEALGVTEETTSEEFEAIALPAIEQIIWCAVCDFISSSLTEDLDWYFDKHIKYSDTIATVVGIVAKEKKEATQILPSNDATLEALLGYVQSRKCFRVTIETLWVQLNDFAGQTLLPSPVDLDQWLARKAPQLREVGIEIQSVRLQVGSVLELQWKGDADATQTEGGA